MAALLTAKKSLFGTASLIIGIVWLLAMIVVTWADILIRVGEMKANAVYFWLSRFSDLVFVAAPVGVCLGLTGLLIGNTRKLAPTLGLIINSTITAFILFVMFAKQ